MKTALKAVMLILMMGVVGMTKGFAYSFSAVCETGQTLYYNITDATNHYVELTCPSYDWSGFTKPTGVLVIPDMVEHNNIMYSITNIGNYAFNECSGLTSVSFPNSLISIGGYYAFRKCSGLTSIVFPNSLVSIGGYGAFEYCSGLTSLSFPNSLTTIGNSAFEFCIGLTSVTFPNSLLIIDDCAFNQCDGITSIVIPNSVTSIGNCSFYRLYNLASIIIGSSVSSIGPNAFRYCNGLTSIRVLVEEPPVLGDNAFGNVPKNIPVSVPGNSLDDYQVAAGWNEFSNFIAIPPYFTIESLSNGNTITFSIPSGITSEQLTSVSYSTDGTNWTKLYINSTNQSICVTLNIGERVYFKGVGIQYGYEDEDEDEIYNCHILATGNFNACGNIMSLLYGDDFATVTEYDYDSDAIFYGLFKGNTHLVSAENLQLPATDLPYQCYGCMFEGCSSLTTAPELPATSLGPHCYGRMFEGCSSLITPPELPATNVYQWAYYYMFSGCTSLTVAPELPATTIRSYDYSCYAGMFSGCTSLTTAPALPATTLASSCYSSMFSGCTSLTTAPVLPATILASNCYSNMFKGCTSLASAPVLPATTLADWCYYQMFKNCSLINEITCLATDISATNCTNDWLSGVASTGTFHKSPEMQDWPLNSQSGIPEGWTVIGNNYEITATANPSEGGTVTGAGEYEDNSTCTLTATPIVGYMFAYWTENGAFVSNDNSYTFTVTNERTLVANFIPHRGNVPEGAIGGLFSVSDNKQVYFSQGNLQYIGSADTPYWQFAGNQWDCLNNNQDGDSQTIDRDRFGWGTSGYNHGATCYQPWSNNTFSSNYYAYGSQSYNLNDQTGMADWGYNVITNGGNQEHCGWRSLTTMEWRYIFNTRSTNSGIRYAKGIVNNINGVIILPDDWSENYYSLSNTNESSANFSNNNITAQQWLTLEDHGAVFLPASSYWSASYSNNLYAWGVVVDVYLSTANDTYRSTRRSVRLVRPTSLKLPVSGYGSGSGKWVFIASPVVEDLNPTTVTNLIGGGTAGNYDYDLFRYNPSAALGWENYVNHTDGFVLQNGKGYLYAREETADIEFIGTLNTGTIKTVALNQGWNLVGNPFVTAVNVNKPFYRMNETGTDIEPVLAYSTTDIPACTGVVVKATGTSETVTFTQSTSKASSGDNGLQMTLAKTGSRGNEIQDKAIVSFNEDAQLEKFVFNEDHAKLYIFQDDEDFAIAFSERKSEIPVHFIAKELGTYTISFSGEDMSDIKLVDKLDNVIIDLGVNDSYTFIGSPADSIDRFRLVFGDAALSTGSETEVFAYQNGNDIIVNGEGELHVFDVMGRMVATQQINGVQTIAAPQTGVYILRLDGKTQKIVIR